MKSISFTCDECGGGGNRYPYLYTTCHLMCHQGSTSLRSRSTVNTIFHPHPLILHKLVLENESDGPFCRICKSELLADYYSYSCSDCNYFVHVECLTDYAGIHCKTDSDHELNPSITDELMSSITCIVKEINIGEEVVVTEIKHFSHHHSLTLSEEAEDDKRCSGCLLPILQGPFYSCAQCDFFLHKACLELPRQMRHQDFKNPLILFPKAPTVDGIFFCTACEQYSNGFAYLCNKSNTYLDVRCAPITDPLRHEGHDDHILFSCPKKDCCCSGCSKPLIFVLHFDCPHCQYTLDYDCATLPRTARHRYDKHLLTLTYSSDFDDSGEYYYDICEYERDPNHWFYYCADCDFAAHPKCLLGRNRYIKLGGTCTYDVHPHPLTLVQKTKNYPPCSSCGKPCDDLALECTLPDCSFIIHRKGNSCLFLRSE